MPWTVIIHRAARNALKRLDRPVRQRIAEQIQALGDDPDNPALDVKPLAGRSGYRMRVGGWRILFTRDDEIRVIAIEQIKPRGDAYK
jgi:mRNA interferase RelE/StbE